jgi:hypothetical protein
VSVEGIVKSFALDGLLRPNIAHRKEICNWGLCQEIVRVHILETEWPWFGNVAMLDFESILQPIKAMFRPEHRPAFPVEVDFTKAALVVFLQTEDQVAKVRHID